MKARHLALCAASFLAAPMAMAQEFKADVPDNVLTPDQVETQTLGSLEFFDGMPSEDTVQKVFDNLDLLRATTAFLDGMKIASMRAMLQGYEDMGVQPNEVVIAENLLDARSIWLTPNTTTIYIGSNVDISEGPMVIEVPAGLLGLVDDAAFELRHRYRCSWPRQGRGRQIPASAQ